MKKLLTAVILSSVMASSAFAASAVRAETVSIGLSAQSDEAVGKLIFDACKARKWVPVKQSDNEIIATLNARSYTLVISIKYSKDGYSIAYKDSRNMSYNARRNTIHSTYIRLIKNLNRDIQNKINYADANDQF
jgi:opacity protein-like surface antigen